MIGRLGQELVQQSAESSSTSSSSNTISSMLPNLSYLSSLVGTSEWRIAAPARAGVVTGTGNRTSRRERTSTEELESGDEYDLSSYPPSRETCSRRRPVDPDCSTEVNLPDISTRSRSADEYSSRGQSSAPTSLRSTRWSWSEKDKDDVDS